MSSLFCTPKDDMVMSFLNQINNKVSIKFEMQKKKKKFKCVICNLMSSGTPFCGITPIHVFANRKTTLYKLAQTYQFNVTVAKGSKDIL